MSEKPAEKSAEKPNAVLIGKKPVLNYVVACVTFFNQGVDSITLKARGAAISKAVDVVELLGRSFIKGLTVRNIQIGTEVVERENRKSNVSTLEICVDKPKT